MRCPIFSEYRRPLRNLALLWFPLGAWAVSAQEHPSEQDLTSMSIEELTQVKVFTASRHLEDSRNAPSAVSVITAEEIARYGWQTLADVLHSVRGFYTAYDRDFTYMGVRGVLRSGDYNSRILLMVNGHRLNDQVYDSAQVGTEFPLDLDLIDHIEIVRGPSSSLFGTNAVFGVINVITRQPSAQAVLEGSISTSSFQGIIGQLTASFQQKGFSVLLSGSMYRSAGQHQLFFPEFASPETNNGLAVNMDGDHYDHAFADVQWKNFRLQGLFSNRTKQTPTAPYETNFNDPRTRSRDERDYLDLSYHRSISRKTDMDVRGYYDSYYSMGAGSVGGTDPSTNIMAYTTGRADWLGAEVNFGVQLGRQRITAGADYEHCIRIDQKNYFASTLALLDDHRSPQQGAAYGQVELNLIPRLTINAGGRLDWYDTFGAALSPRIAAIYKLNPRTSIKYIFGRAFRAPNAYESYYVDSLVIGEPNPHLQPENIQTHEVVLEQSLRPWLQATVDGFYNNLRNLIDEAPDPADGLTHFVNAGRVRGRGLEFELEAKRKSGLSARASYTVADAEDLADHSRLANSPLHTAKLNTSIPLLRHTFAGVEMLYSSAQKSYQGAQVPWSFLTNVTVSTSPLWGGWQFSGSCYNAFNRRWSTGAGPENREPQIQQDGRTFRFKVSYRLPIGEKRSRL